MNKLDLAIGMCKAIPNFSVAYFVNNYQQVANRLNYAKEFIKDGSGILKQNLAAIYFDNGSSLVVKSALPLGYHLGMSVHSVLFDEELVIDNDAEEILLSRARKEIK